MSFDTLGLNEVLLKSLTDSGYETPTEVQARTIPAALAGSEPDTTDTQSADQEDQS